MKRIVLTSVLLLSCCAASLTGAPRVRAEVDKRVVLAGQEVTLTCTLEPDPHNEYLTLAFGRSGGYGTSSTRRVEATTLRQSLTVAKGKLSCGDYLALCALTQRVNDTFVYSHAYTNVSVKGRGCS